MDYAKALSPFRRVLRTFDAAQESVEALEKLDQSKGCSISYAADMCQTLTNGLCEMDETEPRAGRVTGANWDSNVRGTFALYE